MSTGTPQAGTRGLLNLKLNKRRWPVKNTNQVPGTYLVYFSVPLGSHRSTPKIPKTLYIDFFGSITIQQYRHETRCLRKYPPLRLSRPKLSHEHVNDTWPTYDTASRIGASQVTSYHTQTKRKKTWFRRKPPPYYITLLLIASPGKMPFRVAISTAPDPQGIGRVDILTHPYTTAACAAGEVTGTARRDSLRYRYSGNRRTRQLARDCEGNRVKSTHDVFENTNT